MIMEIDLTKVPIRTFNYEGPITIPSEWYKNMAIEDIKDVTATIKIYRNLDQDDILAIDCHGKFVLQDARDLHAVLYPFNFSFVEKIALDSDICGRFLENSQNTLDIMAILWENIVLENPISYTESEPLKNEEQTGWEIVGEDKEQKVDPRLAPLMELFNKKKE